MFILGLFLTMQNAIADKENLNKKYEWERKPAIELCGNTNVTVEEVNTVLLYWQGELEKASLVSDIYYKPTCSKNKLNLIVIKDDFVKSFHGELARTSIEWYWYDGDDTQYLDTATISFPNNISYKRHLTLTHELGHALGYQHSNHSVMKSHI